MKNRKVLVLTILIILIVLVTGLSISYAFSTSVHVGNNSNIVKSGCLNIEFTDMEGAIDSSSIYPGYYTGSDDKGASIFTITNKCSTRVSYDLNLETLDGSDLNLDYISVFAFGNTLGNKEFKNMEELSLYLNTLDSNDFYNSRILYDELIVSHLSSETPVLSDSLFSNNLYRGVLKENETHLFQLAYLLKYDTPLEETNKTWNNKIVVNSNPLNKARVSFDSNGGNESFEDILLYKSDDYGELPTPTKDGYKFKYWYIDNEENGAVFSDSTVLLDSNHTLKAKWVSNTMNSYLKENSFYEYLREFSKNHEYYNSDNVYNFLPYNGILTENLLMDEDFLSENNFSNVTKISTDDSTYPTYVFTKCLEENKKYNIYYYSDVNIIMTKDHIVGVYNTADLSLIDTSLMTDMSHMFERIVFLNLILNNFDTSNVTNMSYMFANCDDIEILDLKYLNTSKVTDMSYMFYRDFRLTTLKIDNFSDDSLTNTEYMFYNCSSLKNINLNGFSGKTIENDKGMLCNKMEYGSSLDVTGYTVTDNNSDCSDMH